MLQLRHTHTQNGALQNGTPCKNIPTGLLPGAELSDI